MQERKKVLFVATVLKTHIFAFHLPYIKLLHDEGYEVHVAAKNDFGSPNVDIPFCDKYYDIDFDRSPVSLKNLFAYFKLKKILEENNYALIHCHTPVAGFLGRMAARKLQSKVLYTAHGFHFYKGAPYLKYILFLGIERLSAKWTDHIIVINNEDYVAAIKYLMPEEKVSLMPGIGIDLKKYSWCSISQNDIASIRDDLGLDKNDVLITMIAEFIPRKRHKDVILALSMVRNHHVHLAFAGSGPLLEDMKKLAALKGVAERVHFLGYRNNIPQIIKASKVTILVSQQEGLPRSVMESMALKVPVIGTKIRGTYDLLKDGCGILVPVGDVEKLAKMIDYAVDNDKEMQTIVAKAFERCKRYDLSAVLKRHLYIYQSLLN